jgi:hypothetical protein
VPHRRSETNHPNQNLSLQSLCQWRRDVSQKIISWFLTAPKAFDSEGPPGAMMEPVCALLRSSEDRTMAHLPMSYEDRCLRTWFTAPDVQDSHDNPQHFCAHSRAHSLECTCKCGVVEGAVIPGAPRIETHYESDSMGSKDTDHLRMGQSAIGEEAHGVEAGLSAGAVLSPSVRT